MTTTIELHIEELVLHGVAPGDRHLIAEALESDLARLFAAGPGPERWPEHGGAGRLETGSFRVATGSRAEATGAQVAQAVFKSVTR